MEQLWSKRPLAAALWACVCVVGCGSRGEGEVRIVERTRGVDAAYRIRWNATSAERFRLNPIGAPGEVSALPRPGGLTVEAPAGWVEFAPTSMRAANFLLSGDPRAECYVTLLGGDGGGALANVNRWRGQLGQPGLSSAELEALPRVPMLGGEALVVEIAGSLEAASGTIEDALLIGAVRLLPERAVFVKMIGPRELVQPARDVFLALCASLDLGE